MEKRVLITGGTRGLGKAMALAFKEAGYKVAVLYGHNKEAADALEKDHQIKAFQSDVSNFAACKDAINKVTDYLGGTVQVLINNAGITKDKMLHKLEEGEIEDFANKVITSNLLSVFYLSGLVIKAMREEGFGRIISISSVNANGASGQTNYAASKAGIEGFTKSLALESAKAGVTVNAIAPGYIDTEMVRAVPGVILEKIIAKVPVNRLGQAEEIAKAALFLASPDSGFITGTVLSVNGGLRT
jgi:acetoacetyl-CoA reductase